MTSYVALMRKEKGSIYGVDFPDFPGCISAGETMEEARWMAQEALEGHVELMLEDGDPMPEPSSLETIMKDPGNAKSLVVAFLVTLPPLKAKAVRINVTMHDSVLARVDAYVKEHREVKSRSGFLAKAAKEYIELHGGRPAAGKKRKPGGKVKA